MASPKKMSAEKHLKRHQELHKALDELAADWLSHQPVDGKKLFSNTSIINYRADEVVG